MTTAAIARFVTLMLALGLTEAARGDPSASIAALGGADAVAEAAAIEDLLKSGDGAVKALEALAGDAGKPLPPRLIAVELLGRIGTPAAVDALMRLLPGEKDLAVRGQICMQLGRAGDRRAVGVIAEWLKTIGPGAIDDLPNKPKESQPSTCYIRHIEALGMIGDPSAIPAIEAFAAKVPKNVGYGGFLTNFVLGAANEALEDLKARADFWAAVRRHDGLEPAAVAVLAHLRRDRVARFRLADDEVIRRTQRGREVLAELKAHRDPALATAAGQLLGRWDDLRK